MRDRQYHDYRKHLCSANYLRLTVILSEDTYIAQYFPFSMDECDRLNIFVIIEYRMNIEETSTFFFMKSCMVGYKRK